MINWKHQTIFEPQKLGRDRGTHDIHLPKHGGVSSLEVILSAENGSAGNVGNPLTGTISKVSVTDGRMSYIYSLSAAQIQTMAAIVDRHSPEITEPTTAGATQKIRLPLRFGRFAHDGMYGRILDKMSEPMLQIEYDLETVRACGNNAFVSGSLSVELDGMLCSSEEARNLPAYIATMPAGMGATEANTDYTDYRMNAKDDISMTIYAKGAGVADGDTFTKVELFDSTTNHTLLKGSWIDLQRQHLQHDGSIVSYAVHVPMSARGTPESRPTRQMPDRIDLKARMLTAGVYPVIIREMIKAQ